MHGYRTVYIPGTNMDLFELVLIVTLVQVTVEAWSATIRNSDTSVRTPLILVMFVSVAVTFPLISLVLLLPGVSCVVNRRGLPCPMYSVLLQARIKLVPLIVQVKRTSSPRQARLPLRRVLVNSWHDTQTAAATLYIITTAVQNISCDNFLR